jgi:4-amino-4-deoxy-L-arabinose transferase-like glycosyltransferase
VTVKRSLAAICLVAAAHGMFFIAYQRPDWMTRWTDQEGYRRLGEVLASTGKFTRYPESPVFVPEVLRTPVYPAFVAVVYTIAGKHHVAVAAAQTVVFVLICLTMFAIGQSIGGPRLGVAAATVTALYPTLPYFGALVLTEVWTAFMFTLTMWMLVRAAHEQRRAQFVWFGVLAAATALSRPAFFLFLPGIVGMALVLFPLVGWRERPAWTRWALSLGVYALAMLPWFTYNYVTMHRFTLSPAGGIGRGIWEGSWQGYWAGRLQSQLTDLADETPDRAALDSKVTALAAAEHLDPAPMLDYTHQEQDIRKIWTEPRDPLERTRARIAADDEYLRVGLRNSARDRTAHLKRRVTRGIFVLWSADIPIRYSQINSLPTIVIRLIWLAQTAILGLAALGLLALVRARRYADALLLAAPIIYVTAVHFPLLTEARQSLPAKPIVLLLAVLGAGALAGRSFALEPQVHEREHL